MERCAKRKQIEDVPVEHILYFQKERAEEQLDRNTDLHSGLVEKRAKLDQRLKATFESIFEKYGRDFEGVGDEIDIATGEIVVNNGHVLRMQDEKDAGEANYWKKNEDKFANEPLKSSYLSLAENDLSCNEDYLEQDTKPLNNLKVAESLYDQDEDDLILRGFVQANPFLKLSHEEILPQPAVPLEGSPWSFAPGTNMFHTALLQKNYLPARTELDLSSRLDDRFSRYTDRKEDDVEPAWRVPYLPKPQKDLNFYPTHRNQSKKLDSLQKDHSKFAEATESLWAPIKTSRRERFESDNTRIYNGKMTENGEKKGVKETWNYFSGSHRNLMFSMQSGNTHVSKNGVSLLNWTSESLYQGQTELHVSEEVKSKNGKLSSKSCKDLRSMKPVREPDNIQTGKNKNSTLMKTYRTSLSVGKHMQNSNNLLVDKSQIRQDCPSQPSQAQNNHESILGSIPLDQAQEIRNPIYFEPKANLLMKDNCTEVPEKGKTSTSRKDKRNNLSSSNTHLKHESIISGKVNQDKELPILSQSLSQPFTDKICHLDKRISNLEVPVSYNTLSKNADSELNPNNTNKVHKSEDQDFPKSSQLKINKVTSALSSIKFESVSKDKECLSMEQDSPSKFLSKSPKVITASSFNLSAKAMPCKVASSPNLKSCENISSSAYDPHTRPTSVQEKADKIDSTCEGVKTSQMLQESDSGSHQSSLQELISVSTTTNHSIHGSSAPLVPTISSEQHLKPCASQNKPSLSAHSIIAISSSRDRGLGTSKALEQENFNSTSHSNSEAPEKPSRTPPMKIKASSINPATCLQVDEMSSQCETNHFGNLSAGSLDPKPHLHDTKKEFDLLGIEKSSVPHSCTKKNANLASSKISKVKNSFHGNANLLTPATCSRLPEWSKGSWSSKIIDRRLTNSVGRKLFKSSLISIPKSEDIDELSLDQSEQSGLPVFLECIKNEGVLKVHKIPSAVSGEKKKNLSLSTSRDRDDEDEDELSAEYMTKYRFNHQKEKSVVGEVVNEEFGHILGCC